MEVAKKEREEKQKAGLFDNDEKFRPDKRAPRGSEPRIDSTMKGKKRELPPDPTSDSAPVIPDGQPSFQSGLFPVDPMRHMGQPWTGEQARGPSFMQKSMTNSGPTGHMVLPLALVPEAMVANSQPPPPQDFEVKYWGLGWPRKPAQRSHPDHKDIN